MRTVLFLWFLLPALPGYSQHILAGKVTDANGAPIPGVKVSIENTTYGIITDYNGAYYLELQHAKTYAVVFRMLGMEDTTVNVDVSGKYTTLDMVLQEKVMALETVDVVVKKENIANSIIKKVQDNRKNMARQYESASCKTYFKTSLYTEIIPGKKDTVVYEPETTSLIESVSITTYVAPHTYHEEILAHHDYSDKIETTSGAFMDYLDDGITPMQDVLVDPYIFFEKTQDGDFDLYQAMINLPKITEHPITSPVGMLAFTNYSFDLTNVFFEGDQKIYEIKVTPLYKGAALVEGHLYILDSLWVVKSFTVSVNPSSLIFFSDFTVIQDYENVDGYWVAVRREYSYTIKDDGHLITANTRVDHSEYKFNQITNRDNPFKNEISHYNDEAFSRDSLYWDMHRPIQLKEEELGFIALQNRIDSIKESERYLDSLDAEFNKITFFDVTLNGIGLRNRYKKQEIYIAPLLNVDFFGVGGFRYELEGSYSKKFDNSHAIKISPTLNYGFNNRDLKYILTAEYTFLPRKFGSVEVTVGDMYERLTNQLNAVNWFLGGNSSVRNKFYSTAYRQELVNGLYGRVKFSYANRQPLDSVNMGPVIEYLESIDTSSIFDLFYEPVNFEPYTSTMIEFKFQYRFKQQYIIKNNEKLIIGTAYPELEMTFRQGIPGLFNSDVNFSFIELKASDEIELGNFGDSKWKLIGGMFLNTEELRIIEHKYFKAADIGFFSNPLNTHQTLDTMLNTGSAYIQAFYIHHFNGIVLNKIPLIRKLKFEGVAGASTLLIPDQDFLLSEVYFGVERKFRIRNQYLKYGFYYVIGGNTAAAGIFKFKIGFDAFNTFTNEWSW